MKKLTLTLCLMAVAVISTQAQSRLFIKDSAHGTYFGRAANQGLAFYGATPIVQPSAGQDPYGVLQALGLIAAGNAPEKYAGITYLSGTQSPIASGLASTVPAVFVLTTATNSAAPYAEYILTSGSTGWKPVLTGTGP